MNSVTKVRELRFNSILKADSNPCHQMADKWSNIIENSKSGYSAVVDVNMWVGKATLDACVPVPLLSVHGLQTKFLSQGSALELSITTLVRWTKQMTP